MNIKLLTIATLLAFSENSAAQTVTDTVSTLAGYSQNVWYSLENDNQAVAPVNNWDIALATTVSQANPLTTALLFNHKKGSLYEIPGSDPDDFENADTTGLSSWTPLFNSDTTWSVGAFNNTTNLGSFDYGWGTYDMVNHSGINANRVFVIKYTDGTFKKLMISLTFSSASYDITFANLDNSDLTTETLVFTPYTDKNFVYYSLTTGVTDREAATEDWDLTFMQYPSSDYDPPYMVAGILQNVGVEVAQVYPVNDVTTFIDFSSVPFENQMNVIGYDWKTFGMGWTIADSTVYFVKDKTGSVWKVVMTGFTGSASGEYIFTKEKISAASLNEANNTLAFGIYPNPVQEDAVNVCFYTSLEDELRLTISDLNGKTVHTEVLANATSLQFHTIRTNQLEAGTYILTASTGKAVQQTRFIIQ